MRLLGTAMAFLIAAIGVLGVFSPTHLLEVARMILAPDALYGVAVVRIVFGAVLVLAASASSTPRTLRILGTLIIIAGVLTPFFGVERSRAVFSWWSSQPLWFMRAWSSVAVIFGGFIIYALRSRKQAAA